MDCSTGSPSMRSTDCTTFPACPPVRSTRAADRSWPRRTTSRSASPAGAGTLRPRTSSSTPWSSAPRSSCPCRPSSRAMSTPLDSVVVSCTELVTDGARNAIPGRVVIRGDARTFTDADSELVEARIREITEGAALAHRASCEVSYTRVFRPTINDAGCLAHATAAARTALGPDKVDSDCRAITASEDFAAYARQVPACFAFLGAGDIAEGGTAPLHSRGFDFNDAVLGAGIDF